MLGPQTVVTHLQPSYPTPSPKTETNKGEKSTSQNFTPIFKRKRRKEHLNLILKIEAN